MNNSALTTIRVVVVLACFAMCGCETVKGVLVTSTEILTGAVTMAAEQKSLVSSSTPTYRTTTPSYPSAASSSAVTARPVTPSKPAGYSAYEMNRCISLDNDGNTLASFLRNSCSVSVSVYFVPVSGLGSGSSSMLTISAGGRQSTNKTAGIRNVMTCRGYDSLNRQSAICRP
jgi:hypothetical protein